MRAFTLVLPLLSTACATEPWTDFYGDPHSASIPRDVRDFVKDAQGCGHFSGEEPYDAERAATIKKATDALCRNLETRHSVLTRRYADNAPIFALITKAWIPFE